MVVARHRETVSGSIPSLFFLGSFGVSFNSQNARGPFSETENDGLEAVLVRIVCYPQREGKFGVVLFFCGPFVSFGGGNVGRRKACWSRLIKRRWRGWPGWVSAMTLPLGGSGPGKRVGGAPYSTSMACVLLHLSGFRTAESGGGVLHAVMTEEWQSEVHLTGRQKPSRGGKSGREKRMEAKGGKSLGTGKELEKEKSGCLSAAVGGGGMAG